MISRLATTESTSATSTFWPSPVCVAMPQRGQQADRHRQARQHIGHRGARAGRLAAGPAGGAHQAAHRLGDDVVARAQPIRPGVAEAGDRRIDQPRVHGLQRVVAQAELVHRAGAVVLHHHVGGLHEVEEQLAAGLEVERHALLAAVQVHVVRAFAVPERCEVARVVAAAGLLDLDDLGAHVGQHHGAEGAGEHAGQVEDAQSGECASAVSRSIRVVSCCVQAFSKRVPRRGNDKGADPAFADRESADAGLPVICGRCALLSGSVRRRGGRSAVRTCRGTAFASRSPIRSRRLAHASSSAICRRFIDRT